MILAPLKFCLIGLLFANANAQSPPAGPVVTLPWRGEAYVIDLPAVLRLAEAQNLDVQIARERVAEAKARRDSATLQFFPWLSPGISYRRHDDYIQDVAGNILDVHKQSYAPGVTVGTQLDIGEALYKSLAAKQQLRGSEYALQSERQKTVHLAAQNYFDLMFAQSSIEVAQEAIRISTNYQAQLHQAVEAGLAFRGDELRVRVQADKNRLTLQQASEQRRVAGVRLAQTLRLDPTIDLVAADLELVPILIVDTNASVSTLVAQAQSARPETAENKASINAAQANKSNATKGPLIPTLGAQFFGGALGGDSSAGPSRFGPQEDLAVGLSWKIGPGGLFDRPRKQAAEARLQIARLTAAKMSEEISAQVVEASVRVTSLSEQMQIARLALESAQKALEIAKLRQEFAVGMVLENIQAEQDLTRARSDYLKSIADFNKAQYTLQRAIGKL